MARERRTGPDTREPLVSASDVRPGPVSPVVLEAVTMRTPEALVLDGVSQEFLPGLTTVVMGPAGSGKSSLLKCAAALRDPDEGRVLIFGKDPAVMDERKLTPIRRRCGFAFQDAALWQNMSAAQNLLLPLQVHEPQMSRTEMTARVDSLVRRVGLRASVDRRPADLSLGERKMLGFLRAVVLEPELLFLDEPTTFLDAGAREKLLGYIKELKRQGRTLILATHDPELASQVADVLVILHEGRILESGPTERVIHSPDSRVAAVLTEVLSKTSTYDADILDILGDSREFGLEDAVGGDSDES